MSLTVTQRPNQSGVWVAAKNPVIYKMTRKDYAWTLLVTSAGNTSIRIATNVTASFVAGNIIWLESDDGSYSATGTVVSSAYGTYTTVVTDVPFVANNAAGYINTTTKRSNYYIGVDVYRDTLNTLIGTINYYPTKKGLLTIDVSSILLSVLDPSLPSGAAFQLINDSTAYQGFYIKYTEFWTGSGNGAIDDVANTSYAVIAANQIGQSGYLSASILTKLDSLKIITGEYYLFSFVDIVGYTSVFIRKAWYTPSGVLYAINYIKSDITAAKAIFTYSQRLNNFFTTSQNWFEGLYPYINIDNGGTIAWTFTGISESVVVTTGATSKTGCSLIFVLTGKTIQLEWNLSITGTGSFTASLCWFDSAGTIIDSSTLTTSFGDQTGTISITPTSNMVYVGVKIINSGAGTVTVSNASRLIIPNTCNRIDFNACNVPATLPNAENDFTSVITASIATSCNTITIFWRNSTGGESSWSFNYNQELIQKLQDPYKNKQYTLFDQSLTLSQFNALNELFTLGQVYQTPLIELTTSIDKTEVRIGQQVYIVDSNGVKTGVIVLPGENKTLTKRNKHTFQITIELPEIFG